MMSLRIKRGVSGELMEGNHSVKGVRYKHIIRKGPASLLGERTADRVKVTGPLGN